MLLDHFLVRYSHHTFVVVVVMFTMLVVRLAFWTSIVVLRNALNFVSAHTTLMLCLSCHMLYNPAGWWFSYFGCGAARCVFWPARGPLARPSESLSARSIIHTHISHHVSGPCEEWNNTWATSTRTYNQSCKNGHRKICSQAKRILHTFYMCFCLLLFVVVVCLFVRLREYRKHTALWHHAWWVGKWNTTVKTIFGQYEDVEKFLWQH